MQENHSPAAQFVIEGLADDFESIETLVNYYIAPVPPAFTQAEILRALVVLIDSGHVQAYLYSEDTQKYVPSEFSPKISEKFWFGLTNKGK